MKELYLVLLVLAAGASGLYLHDYYAKEAAAQARAAAAYEAAAQAKQIHKVEISRNLERYYFDLLDDLNQNRPVDLVPTFTVIRERLRDKKALVEAARQPIYAAGDDLLTAMIDVAEDRTSALQALLEANSRTNTLEKQGSVTNSAGFFAQGAVKKWNDERARQKPSLDQLLNRLRQMERDWNQKVPVGNLADSFEHPAIAPAIVKVDPSVASNPLEKGAYNKDRPWRRYYYDSLGYRYRSY